MLLCFSESSVCADSSATESVKLLKLPVKAACVRPHRLPLLRPTSLPIEPHPVPLQQTAVKNSKDVEAARLISGTTIKNTRLISGTTIKNTVPVTQSTADVENRSTAAVNRLLKVEQLPTLTEIYRQKSILIHASQVKSPTQSLLTAEQEAAFKRAAIRHTLRLKHRRRECLRLCTRK
jgi:hypothetical protein